MYVYIYILYHICIDRCRVCLKNGGSPSHHACVHTQLVQVWMILGVALLPFPKKTAMDLGQPAGRAVLPLITRHQHGPATRIDIHKMIAKKRGWQPPRWGKHHMLCYILYVICYIVYSHIVI